MRTARRNNRKKNLGKLLLKTNSVLPNFILRTNGVNKNTKYTVLDENNTLITSGIITIGVTNVSIDLSTSSLEKRIFIDVDNSGNGIYYQYYWYNSNFEITFFDLDTIPLTSTFWVRDTDILVKNDSGNNNINSSYFYNVNFQNIDFINNNISYTKLRIYGNNDNDFILNILNKPNLNYISAQSNLMRLQSTDFSGLNNLKFASFNLKNPTISNYNYKFNVNVIEEISLQHHSCNYDVNVQHPKLKTLLFYNIKDNSSIDIQSILNNAPVLEKLTTNGIYININSTQTVSHNVLNYLYIYSNQITSLSISNTPNLKKAYLRLKELTSDLIIDTISQKNIEYIDLTYTTSNELDLSHTENLNKLYVQYSHIRKINIKNGHNDLLVTMNHHTEYVDCCFLIDDINNPPPAFATQSFRAGDVITDDINVYNNF